MVALSCCCVAALSMVNISIFTFSNVSDRLPAGSIKLDVTCKWVLIRSTSICEALEIFHKGNV